MGVVKPRLDGDRIIWIGTVRARRVIKDENGGQVGGDSGEVLGVGAEVEGAVLPVVAPVQHPLVAVQFVRHGRPVDLHARREHNQLEPLGNDGEKEINVRPFVNEKSDWMSVNGDFEDEVWRRPRLDGLTDHAIVVGVDQGFVQVQHQSFLPHHVESVSRYGGQWRNVIPDSFVLLHCSDLFLEDITNEAPDF